MSKDAVISRETACSIYGLGLPLAYVAQKSLSIGILIAIRNVAVTAAAIFVAHKIIPLAAELLKPESLSTEGRKDWNDSLKVAAWLSGSWVGMSLAGAIVTAIVPPTVIRVVGVMTGLFLVLISRQLPKDQVTHILKAVKDRLGSPDWAEANEHMISKMAEQKPGLQQWALQVTGPIKEDDAQKWLTSDCLARAMVLYHSVPQNINDVEVTLDGETIRVSQDVVDNIGKLSLEIGDEVIDFGAVTNILTLADKLKSHCTALHLSPDTIGAILNMLSIDSGKEAYELVEKCVEDVLSSYPGRPVDIGTPLSESQITLVIEDKAVKIQRTLVVYLTEGEAEVEGDAKKERVAMPEKASLRTARLDVHVHSTIDLDEDSNLQLQTTIQTTLG
jgi:hypothetical protein